MTTTYNIKEGQDDTTPINELVIQKHGYVIEFSLGEVEKHIEMLQQMKKEFSGKVALDTAKLKNIIEHHPEILALSEQQLFTAHMYWDLLSNLKPVEAKLTEIDAELETYAVDLGDIKSQIPQLDA